MTFNRTVYYVEKSIPFIGTIKVMVPENIRILEIVRKLPSDGLPVPPNEENILLEVYDKTIYEDKVSCEFFKRVAENGTISLYQSIEDKNRYCCKGHNDDSFYKIQTESLGEYFYHPAFSIG